MPKVAIYPGSFDPVTNGHIDIVERGLKLFDKIIVSILYNPKSLVFDVASSCHDMHSQKTLLVEREALGAGHTT